MPSTPIYGLPYPSLSDPPNGPAQFQALAEAVEAELDRIDDTISGVPISQVSSVSATVSTVSTTYVALAGDPGLSFTAPASGRVMISISAALTGNAADTYSMMGFQVRTGSVVGSGTIIRAVNDEDVMANLGTSDLAASRVTLVTGLTATDPYNVQVLYKRFSGTGTSFFARRNVIVQSVS
jgi:hypothetical protein